jgi:excisionase family DNA binding protein
MSTSPDVTGNTGENPEALRLALTPEEAARAIGVGRSTIYQLLESGQLRSVRIGTATDTYRRGKRYVVPLSAIEEFLGPEDRDPAA